MNALFVMTLLLWTSSSHDIAQDIAHDTGRLALATAPETELAVRLAEAIGATVRELHIRADASVSAAERVAIRRAVERTGLFRLSPAGDSSSGTVLTLRRLSPEVLLCTVTSSDDRRLWVSHARWPAKNSAAVDAVTADSGDAKGAPSEDLEALHGSRLAYRRERLRIQPIVRTFWTYPPRILFSGYSSRMWLHSPTWNLHAGPLATTSLPGDWVIIRGAAEVVDDLGLAELLKDAALQQKIEATRQSRQLTWGLGFGGFAAASIGTAMWLYSSRAGGSDVRRDRRAVAASLCVVGAASGIMAMMFPIVGRGHTLSASEAAKRIDAYNEQWRSKLGLSPADVEGL